MRGAGQRDDEEDASGVREVREGARLLSCDEDEHAPESEPRDVTADARVSVGVVLREAEETVASDHEDLEEVDRTCAVARAEVLALKKHVLAPDLPNEGREGVRTTTAAPVPPSVHGDAMARMQASTCAHLPVREDLASVHGEPAVDDVEVVAVDGVVGREDHRREGDDEVSDKVGLCHRRGSGAEGRQEAEDDDDGGDDCGDGRAHRHCGGRGYG